MQTIESLFAFIKKVFSPKYFLLAILLFISIPIKAQWTEVGVGSFLGGDIMSLMEHNNVIYAGGTAYLFRSEDLGNSWEAYFELFAYAWSLTKSNNTLYCGLFVSSGQTAAVYKSTNNGSDWVSTSLAENILTMVASDSQVFASTINGKIFLTTDAGQNWAQVSSGMLAYLFLDSNKIYSAGQGLRVSTDNGISWNLIHSDNGISCFAKDSIIYFGTQDGKVYRSSNYGQSWLTALNKPGAYVHSLFSYDNIVFAGTDSGLFISNDGGFNFVNKNDNLGKTRVTDIIYYNGDIYLANGDYASVPVSIWKRPISQLTSVDFRESVLPKQIELFQNFPNPFNNSTKIYFRVPENYISPYNKTIVTIKVYDINGNAVSELYNGEIYSTDNYINFEASSLSSGVYFLRLTANNNTDESVTLSKKIILLK